MQNFLCNQIPVEHLEWGHMTRRWRCILEDPYPKHLRHWWTVRYKIFLSGHLEHHHRSIHKNTSKIILRVPSSAPDLTLKFFYEPLQCNLEQHYLEHLVAHRISICIQSEMGLNLEYIPNSWNSLCHQRAALFRHHTRQNIHYHPHKIYLILFYGFYTFHFKVCSSDSVVLV